MLAASGCGGDSDAQTASTAGSQKSREASTTNASPASSKASEGQKPSSPSSSPTPGEGKQGPHLKLPKGPPEPEATPAEQAQATVANVALSSSAVDPATGSALPSAYTCDGKDSPPAFDWHGVPPDAKELALFAMNSQPVNGKLFFDWAVAGIDPSLEGLEADTLPKGAVTGRNDFGKTGYSICPAQGHSETYIFALYTLPKRLSAQKGFDPHVLREEILDLSGNAGLLAAFYARG